MNAPQIIDLAPRLADVRQVVLDGLSTTPKCLPAWLFYDAEGSRLFEQICEQPEYYPTRTELAIFKQHGRDIAAALGENCRIVELGSGSERKARALLRLLRDPDGYVAIDISGEQLREAITALMLDFPHIPMTGIVADYGEDAALPLEDSPGDGPLVGFFPGSTIGNMTPADAQTFLAAWAERLQGGGMLVGVDLVKDEAVLNSAYNDAAGVTAAFNRNMLTHINAALGAGFEPDRFHHHAFFNAAASRIEMHLVSEALQQVNVASHAFDFARGETLHTESSYKYSVSGFQSLARAAGFVPEKVWTDANGWFSVHYLRACG